MDSIDHAIDEAIKDWMAALDAHIGESPTLLKGSSSVTELGISAALQQTIAWMKEVPTSRPGHVHYSFGERPEFYFGFLEKSEFSTLVIQTAVVTVAVMISLFYLTRLLAPSLRTHRRGLAWTLTWYSAIVLFLLSMLEVVRLRTPAFEWMGWGRLAHDTDHISVLTRWIDPITMTLTQHTLALVEKADALAAASVSPKPWSTSLQRLAYQVAAELADLTRATLQGVENSPLFSLAPLTHTMDQPLIASHFAPFSALSSWISNHGHNHQPCLVSLENFPHESRVVAISIGVFLGYSIADLVMGKVYYLEHIDTISGKVHHVFFSWLALRLVAMGRSDLFVIGYGPLELSTSILALGYVFPRVWGNTILVTFFFLLGAIFNVALLHEVMFNYPAPLPAVVFLSSALLIHGYRWYRFIRQQQPLALQQKERGKQSERPQKPREKDTCTRGQSTTAQPRPAIPATTSSGSQGTLLLRTNPQAKQKSKAKAKFKTSA